MYSPPMEKTRRHKAILDLLGKEDVASQERLSHRLARRGFRVTQSTLSRDLKELRVSRITTAEGYRYMHGTAGKISKTRRHRDGRRLTDNRRFAPTSVHLRRNPRSRSAESVFNFTGIRSGVSCVATPRSS